MAQLYVLRAKETGKVKIGITIDIDKRLSNYKTHASEPIEILTAFEVGGDGNAAYRLEQFLLGRCRGIASHGEWVNPTAELLEAIKIWAEVYGGNPGEPECLTAERSLGYVERKPSKWINADPTSASQKRQYCLICKYEWMLRSRGDGAFAEPDRCPNPKCRSKRWKTGENAA